MPGAVERLAAAHQARRRSLARRAAAEVGRLWSAVDRGNIARSWLAAIPAVLTVLESAQTIAAASSGPYLDALGEAYDATDGAAPPLRVSAFAGVASDGRELATLIYRPAVTALTAIGQGAPVARALESGRFVADMITRTQVADAGRAADLVALTARTRLAGYVRVLSPPSCSRCAILAGKYYRWNAGFKRHPRCDCTHLPVPSASAADDKLTRPRAYFDQLSKAEQDAVFTTAGAEAIRLGADPAKVVNARRGMDTAGTSETATRSDGTVVNVHHQTQVSRVVHGHHVFVTTEATRRRSVRLMPESIIHTAAGDRQEAVRLLRLHGYLL